MARHFDISRPGNAIRDVCRTARAFGDFAEIVGVDKRIVEQMMPEFRSFE